MRTFTCVADLEKQIEAAAKEAPLAVGVFGRWQGLGDVEIVGRWLSKGYFGGWCVRWRTVDQSKAWGPFKKGLAFYPSCASPEIIAHLPIVK